MTSPAAKRLRRQARKARAMQKAARDFNKKCCRETQIIPPNWTPQDLRVVNPKLLSQQRFV